MTPDGFKSIPFADPLIPEPIRRAVAEQGELPLQFPPLPEGLPPIPVRMVNEYVYCPRLAYLEWVQAEFAHNADTLDGARVHRHVDARADVLPEEDESEADFDARSVWLQSERLCLSGKCDVVEGDGEVATPVDYKRGKRPHIAKGAYDPERVQLCAQGLLLREHGFCCEEGMIWYAGSRERVRVPFDDELIDLTLRAISELRGIAMGSVIPPPLADSPKCPRCSLIGICLPDEVTMLKGGQVTPRPIFAASERALPLYVQEPRAYLRKDGERIRIEVEKQKVAEARLPEVSQIVLYGHAMLSSGLLAECLRRNIPVTHLSYGGWFLGHTVCVGHGNVEVRKAQFRTADDPLASLAIARRLVEAKIVNCRTLLRRNRPGGDAGAAIAEAMQALKRHATAALRAGKAEALLGIEGAAAAVYYEVFPRLFKGSDEKLAAFDFQARNRRPPKDPVNAMFSFAYAMLAREWTMALSAIGLDPYCGFYHRPRFGRPALALDLMEPFRPLVADSVVLTAINNGELSATDFVIGRNACALKDGARKRFIAIFERRMEQQITHPVFGYRISYRRLFEVQARLLCRYLLGEIAEYPQIRTR